MIIIKLLRNVNLNEDKAGVLYPCNVVVQEHPDGRVEVSAANPIAMFQDIQQPQVREVARDASQKIQAVIERLNTPELVSQS